MERKKVSLFLKKNIFLACCFLIFVSSVFLRLHRFSDKEDLFLDEYFSVILANNSERGWGKYIENDSAEFKGQDIRSWFLSKDNSLSQVLEDVDNLHRTTRDSPHTNLYYSFLRLSFLNADTADLEQVMTRGFALNLFFFSLGFLFLLLMSLKLFDSKILVICILAVSFLNPGSIANTMYIRPYQLQETLLILYTYMFIVYYMMLGKDSGLFATWKNMLIIALVSALSLLSGYFSILYIFALCVILLIRIIAKSPRFVPFFIFSMLLCFVFVFFIYNGYLSGVFDYRGEEAMGKFSKEIFIENWNDSVRGVSNEFRNYLGKPCYIYIFLGLLLFALVRRKAWSKHTNLTLGVSLCAFVWIILVMYSAPYKNIRYMLPMFPIFLLFVPATFSFYSKRIQLLLTIVALSWITVRAVKKEDIYIEYTPIDRTYVEERNIPLILGGINGWKQVFKMRYYTKDRTIEFAFDPATFLSKIEKYPESYAFIDADSAAQYVFPDTTRYTFEEKKNPHRFIWYKLIKRDSIK